MNPGFRQAFLISETASLTKQAVSSLSLGMSQQRTEEPGSWPRVWGSGRRLEPGNADICGFSYRKFPWHSQWLKSQLNLSPRHLITAAQSSRGESSSPTQDYLPSCENFPSVSIVGNHSVTPWFFQNLHLFLLSPITRCLIHHRLWCSTPRPPP